MNEQLGFFAEPDTFEIARFKLFKSANFRGLLSGTVKKRDDHTEFTIKSGDRKVNCRAYSTPVDIEKNDYLDVTGKMYIKTSVDTYTKQTDGFILVEDITKITRYGR